MKIGDKVYVIGTIDEIRQDVVIIRNDGGFFGTIQSEIIPRKEEPHIGECETCRWAYLLESETPCKTCNHNGGRFNGYQPQVDDCQW